MFRTKPFFVGKADRVRRTVYVLSFDLGVHSLPFAYETNGGQLLAETGARGCASVTCLQS